MAKASDKITAATQKAVATSAPQSGPDGGVAAEAGTLAIQEGAGLRPFVGEALDALDLSAAFPDGLPQFRFKSERYPYRRGGLVFDAARQWKTLTFQELRETITEEGFKALVDDPVVHVQGSRDDGKTWETVLPPVAEPEDDE